MMDDLQQHDADPRTTACGLCQGPARRDGRGRARSRLGIVGQDDDDDIVQGVVLMRRGEEKACCRPSAGVEAEVEKINSTGVLPPGVHLVSRNLRPPRADQRHDPHRLCTNMSLGGIVLIFFVQWLFLGDLRERGRGRGDDPVRAALFAISISGGARRVGWNLLSVGAIDFGLIGRDATVIMVEQHLPAIFRKRDS